VYVYLSNVLGNILVFESSCETPSTVRAEVSLPEPRVGMSIANFGDSAMQKLARKNILLYHSH